MRRQILVWLIAACILTCPTLGLAAEPKDASGLIFPVGDPNPASKWMFTGQSYIMSLVERDAIWNADTMINVTFEPCCRTDWHSHPGGQILIGSGGIGIHQAEGKEPELILPGTVIYVEPDVMHWHGASDEGWFAHIAVETNPGLSGFKIGSTITDDIYLAALQRAKELAVQTTGQK